MVVPVGTLTQCQTTTPGYAGVYDLVGQVWEWQDSCDQLRPGPLAICAVQGGNYANSSQYLTCGYGGDDALYRRDAGEGVGFRCCSP